MPLPEDLRSALAAAARHTPGLAWLVLHGSRARGEARPESDWDFAFKPSGESVDLPRLVGVLRDALRGEVDVANVERANAVLRLNVASEGIVIFERRAGAFDDFREQAARFWCEAGEVIEEAQTDMLAHLGPAP